MRCTDRNRSNNRSTAFRPVSGEDSFACHTRVVRRISILLALVLALALLIAPVAAVDAPFLSLLKNPQVTPVGTADLKLSENGTLVTASASLIDAESYLLVMPGILGEDVALEKVSNLTLINETGVTVEPKNSKGVLTFPKGNYTLTYTFPVVDGYIHQKFPTDYSARVTLPNPYTTGHLIMGTAGDGVVTKNENSTVVTFNKTKSISIKIYEDNRVPILYLFLAGWVVIFGLAFSRYLRIKKRREKI